MKTKTRRRGRARRVILALGDISCIPLRCTALEALKNIALIMEEPMSFNAFNYDEVFLLAAVDYC
jgi:hypothetical protein